MLYALVNMSGQHPPMLLGEALASVGLLVPADARHDLPPCYARVDGVVRGGGGQDISSNCSFLVRSSPNEETCGDLDQRSSLARTSDDSQSSDTDLSKG